MRCFSEHDSSIQRGLSTTVTFSAYATATATLHAVQALRPEFQEYKCDTGC